MYVVVHENAHEWFGDSVSVNQWKDIWLNEGFATYAEWLWSEHQGHGTASALFDATYSRSATDPFWSAPIGNPTIPQTFGSAVYDRGAMTLNALRVRLGDPTFFALLKDWVSQHQDGTASTAQFIALAEAESGLDLTAFFQSWLFSPSKPAATADNGFPPGFVGFAAAAPGSAAAATPPASFAAIAAVTAALSGRSHGRLLP